MNDLKPFLTGIDYDVPLLRLLAELPGGQGSRREVLRLFEERYGRLIPDEHRGFRKSGQPIWGNNVAWSRNSLKKRGFLEAPALGVWRITDAGRQWLKNNPHATRIQGVAKQRSSAPRKRSRQKDMTLPLINLELLEQTRQLMPADQFRQLWGALYDQLMAEERAKAITQVSQTELGRRTRRWLDDIHAFLSGKNLGLPSSEVLCGWIHMCYTLELYREAAALLPYVHQDEVDGATYKRVKRVADVSRAKLVG